MDKKNGGILFVLAQQIYKDIGSGSTFWLIEINCSLFIVACTYQLSKIPFMSRMRYPKLVLLVTVILSFQTFLRIKSKKVVANANTFFVFLCISAMSFYKITL